MAQKPLLLAPGRAMLGAMIEITDRAVLIRADKYRENDALVAAFSKKYGMIRGIAKRAFTHGQRGTYFVGNWVDITWNARLEEHLGNVTCQLHYAVGTMAARDRLKCYAMNSMCALLCLAFEQRDPHPRLFEAMEELIWSVQLHEQWLADLARFELILLREAGYGLSLDECVATGVRENLIYISPKSGCAVSAEAGAPYADKLFPYPAFIREDWRSRSDMPTIRSALAMTAHFIRLWLLQPTGRAMPTARERLEAALVNAYFEEDTEMNRLYVRTKSSEIA